MVGFLEMLLIGGGLIAVLVGWIKLVVEAFGDGPIWGFACLLAGIGLGMVEFHLFPETTMPALWRPFFVLVQLLYVVTHWHRGAKNPVVLQLAGMAAVVVGIYLAAGPPPVQAPPAIEITLTPAQR